MITRGRIASLILSQFFFSVSSYRYSDVKKVPYLQDVYGEVDAQFLWLVFEELIELVVKI